MTTGMSPTHGTSTIVVAAALLEFGTLLNTDNDTEFHGPTRRSMPRLQRRQNSLTCERAAWSSPKGRAQRVPLATAMRQERPHEGAGKSVTFSGVESPHYI